MKRQIFKFGLPLVAVALLLVACTKEENDVRPTIKQGVYGKVQERWGNWMPVIDDDSDDRGIRPIKRTVYVYEYTMRSDFDSITRYSSPCQFPIEKMPKQLVATSTSDDNGFYQIELAPGTYSIFIMQQAGFVYANCGDGYGGICPVTVNANEVKRFDLWLDNAVY